jgi:hypothetical protein
VERTYPSEAAVRAALRALLVHSPMTGQQVVDEFWIPQSNERVDLALIGPVLKAFEIKTDRDTLKRLPRQANAYSRLFEECTAVVAERHLDEAMRTLPKWWGVCIIVFDNDICFEKARPAGRNPSLDSETLVRLLWRDEAFDALTHLGRIPPSTAGRSWMWTALLELLGTEDVRSVVTQALLKRDPARAKIATRRFSAASG